MFGKIQHLFMIMTTSDLRIEENYLRLINSLDIMVIAWMLHLEVGSEARLLLAQLLFSLGLPATAIGKKNEAEA